MTDVVRIAVAIFEGVEELDFVGPWEVLSEWRELSDREVEILLVGESTEPLTCAKGMRVVPDISWDDLGDIDVLIYPGGRGTRVQLGNESVRARLRTLKEHGTLMTSVCTGALVYADAGLLDGRPATTHRLAFDELLPLRTRHRTTPSRPIRRRRRHHHLSWCVSRYRYGSLFGRSARLM